MSKCSEIVGNLIIKVQWNRWQFGYQSAVNVWAIYSQCAVRGLAIWLSKCSEIVGNLVVKKQWKSNLVVKVQWNILKLGCQSAVKYLAIWLSKCSEIVSNFVVKVQWNSWQFGYQSAVK